MKILSKRAVLEMTGLSNSSLYQLIASNQFPRQIKLSARRVGWLESEVNAWIEARLANRDAQASSQAC